MTLTITSKFTTNFWVKIVLISIFIFGSIITCFVVSIKHGENLSELTPTIIISLIALFVYTYLLSRSLRIITATAEGIVIKYLITKKETTIDYADIIRVSNNKAKSAGGDIVSYSYHRLVIELSTGEELSFTDDNIRNYKELKDAIREYRFHLNHDEQELN
jgi:hypothetical protein